MNCLVTGGTGFLGSHLVAWLIDQGHDVRVLDKNSPANPVEKADYRTGDVTDATNARDAIQGIDWCFHLAGNPQLWAPDYQQFHQPNVVGTQSLLAAATASGTKIFIHCSTEAILIPKGKSKGTGKGRGQQAAPPVWTEATLPKLGLKDMHGGYLRSKYLAEQLVWQAGKRDGGMGVIVVNPTMPIGPGDIHLTPPARMILGFAQGNLPAYLNSAFNVVDVRDAAAAIANAPASGTLGERFVLGGHNVHLKELIATLDRLLPETPMPAREVPYAIAYLTGVFSEAWAKVTRRPPIAPLAGVRLARRKLFFDCTKAQQQLGLSPRPLEATLKDTLQWFQATGLLDHRPQP